MLFDINFVNVINVINDTKAINAINSMFHILFIVSHSKNAIENIKSAIKRTIKSIEPQRLHSNDYIICWHKSG